MGAQKRAITCSRPTSRLRVDIISLASSWDTHLANFEDLTRLGEIVRMMVSDEVGANNLAVGRSTIQ